MLRQCVFGVLGTLLPILAVHAQDDKKNITIISDRLSKISDQEYSAEGNVKLHQDGYIIEANQLNYNATTNMVRASGNVRSLSPQGHVVQADAIQFLGDDQTGIATYPIIYIDGGSARLSAAQAERVSVDMSELRDAQFTTCIPCAKDKTLSWELSASHITWNQKSQQIEYEDIWLKLFDIPLLYAPYYAHPDPNAGRQSGFLRPTVQFSSNLGAGVTIPYYAVLSPQHDATIATTIFSNEYPLIDLTTEGLETWGKFGAQFITTLTENPSKTLAETGTTNSGQSGTQTYEPSNLRSYVSLEFEAPQFGGGQLDAHIQLTSDDTFLRRYNIRYDDQLTSTVQYQWQSERFSTEALGLYTQRLRADEPQELAGHVAPQLSLSTHGYWPQLKTNFLAWGNILNIWREEGSKTQRLSADFEASRSFFLPLGQLLTTTGTLSGDYYRVWDGYQNDLNQASLENCKSLLSRGPDCWVANNTIERTFATLKADWQWPFITQTNNLSGIVTPIIEARLRTDNFRDPLQPNEDSLSSMSIYDISLLQESRTQRDGMIEGSNIQFGANYLFDFQDIGHLRGTIRQTSYPQAGHYIGTASLDFLNGLFAEHKFNIDNQDFSYEAFYVEAGVETVQYMVRTSLDVQNYQLLNETQELVVSGRVALNDQWSLNASLQRDVTNKANTGAQYGISYEDQCLRVNLSAKREYTTDRDFQDETSLYLQIVFLGLGDQIYNAP